MNEIVPIRMSTEDKAKLQLKAKQNRLKLSTYLELKYAWRDYNSAIDKFR